MISKLKFISQYIKDLSFENYAAQSNQFNNQKLNLNLDLNIKKKNLDNKLVEITLVILLEAKNQHTNVFIVELSFASTFILPVKNTEEENKQCSFIDCPNIMFPFIRQIIFNITQNSGFVPVNLDYINFSELYHSHNS